MRSVRLRISGKFASRSVRRVWSRAPFGTQPHAIVDEADVAAAAALVEDGHAGRTYTPTGPDVLTPVKAARIIGDAIGRSMQFVELSPEQMRASGFRDQVIDEVIAYGADPPHVACTVLPTGQEVTGQAAIQLRTLGRPARSAFLIRPVRNLTQPAPERGQRTGLCAQRGRENERLRATDA